MTNESGFMGSSHTKILQDALGSLHMNVETEQSVGPVAQVDLMASLGNTSYLFEVKTGGSEQYLPISAIAEARGTANFMAGTGMDVTPILYTDQTISPACQIAANAMGVPIIKASHDRAIAHNNILNTFQAGPDGISLAPTVTANFLR